jgi:hypothetical protein
MTAGTDPLREVFGPLDGARIPGGCNSCEAYQTPECIAHGVWILKVFHDDWCPTLREVTENGTGDA